ncbi:hypothetical protein [uncultured Fusobacterium sp.]|uniref:hypothetical protein n=1 Tax=uncultured Fusobacterium sp. TaxID=159267 RepID=UPI0025DA8577|nr:hypothetical protein [uncultured Fusobacterium sp.]
MKKRLVIISFLLLSIFSFGKLTDNLEILKDEEKTIIENKINEISEKRDVRIYVNSFLEDEGFVVENAEKLIILNLIKKDENTYKVELKLTKDMELDEYQENINDLLIANEKFLKEKKVGDFVVETLSGVDNILENIKIEEPIVVEEDIIEEKKNGFFIGMGIAFFIIFAIILRGLMIKYHRSFKEEMDIISRKK